MTEARGFVRAALALAALALVAGGGAGAALAQQADRRVKAHVYDVQGDIVILDAGRDAGVTPRLVFDVYMPAKVVRLPMTSEVAYVPERVVAQLVVVDMDPRTSRAKIMPPAPGQPAPTVEKGAFAVSNPTAIARNIAPDVKSLSANPPRTEFGRPVVIRADWTDEKEDIVCFEWQASGGVLSYERSATGEVTWTPPVQKGTYRITAVAVDTAGNRTPRTIDVESAGLTSLGKNVYEARRILADHRQAFSVCRDIAFDEQNAAFVVDSYDGRLVQLTSGWDVAMKTDEAKVKLDLDRIVVRGGDLYATDLYAKRGVRIRIGPKMFQEQPAVSYGGEGVGNGQFEVPIDVAVDAAGQVYILDASERRPAVQVFANDGQFIASFGSLGKGEGQLGKPVAIAAAHDGTIYVLDDARKRVLRYRDLRFAGEFEAGGQTDALLDLKVDPLSGRVCVLEGKSGQIRSFDASGRPIERTFGQAGEALGLGIMNRPKRLRFDRTGELYVIASEGKVIHRCDPRAGEELARWGGIDFTGARRIAAGPTGDVALILPGRSLVVNLDRRGWVKAIFGGEGRDPGKLLDPLALAVGPNGEIAVLDADRQDIQVFSARGALIRAIGKPGKSEREISSPLDLATDPNRRFLAVLESRSTHNMKVYDWEGNLRAAVPGVSDYLSDATRIAMTAAGYVHVALDDGNVAPFDCSTVLARGTHIDQSGANALAKDKWKMRDIDEPSALHVSNLALLFAVAPKSFVQVLDLSKAGAYFAQIKDAKACPSPMDVSADDYDRVYVWDYANGRVVQFGR